MPAGMVLAGSSPPAAPTSDLERRADSPRHPESPGGFAGAAHLMPPVRNADVDLTSPARPRRLVTRHTCRVILRRGDQYSASPIHHVLRQSAVSHDLPGISISLTASCGDAGL